MLPAAIVMCAPTSVSNGLTSYTFHSRGETRPIPHPITCKSKNLIYMTQCERFHKQYVGEKKRRLKGRLNNADLLTM